MISAMKSNIKIKRLTLAITLIGSFFAAPSYSANCNFSEIGGTLVDFGVISAANGGDIDGVRNLRFSCSDTNILNLSIAYTVSISTGSSGNFSARTLQHGSRTIDYNLYTDSNRSLIFGDGEPSSGTFTQSEPPCLNGAACIVTVYGRIDGGQPLSSGQFTDDVVVTITF